MIFWWKRSTATRHSQNAWAAFILEHLTAGATSREAQKEQMKQAYRLVEATNHQQKDMLDIYWQQAEDLEPILTKK
ncbi:hypothetical protein [Marinococcus luteus]|uniref:hypothetical protein n=1 Tax=Marinococcus luteus TaxID=1122204 RepID=UPI002ACCBF4E|nr:hypothetical protein [Marinococcus luteus]MDZ5782406.1 hypothetical protein [Marinococcus luteus]